MKQFFLTLLLSGLSSSLILAQQTPTTTQPASRTTAPAAPTRTLTPAEQRQKEKIDREVQRERQIRAEWLQKQREYEAKQAEKERQRQAKLAGKEQRNREPEQPKAATPAPATPLPAQPTTGTTAAPTESKASRTERRQRRQADQPATQQPQLTDAAPAPAVEPAAPVVAPTPSAEPVSTPARPERPARVRQEKPARVRQVDTVAVRSGDVEMAVRPEVSQPNVSRPRREFLPKGHLFEPILLDPLEAQTYGSVLPSYHSEGRKYAGTIVPFAFGFAKPFYRRTTEPGRSEEIVLDLASFTQFEVYRDAQLDKQRRQIMNNDYKVSILYNVRRGLNTYRFRVYHLSSHLGDDYVYRNRITAPTPNPVNYEILDATYSRVVSDWRLYGGLGVVLRKPAERKTFSAQLGTFYKKPSARAARLVGGVDVKFWQQTDFRPGIHGGIGVEVGRTGNNLTFLLEGYSGFRPYSQYEHQQTSWIGAGVYLNPF